ncbi:MAG: hypothetical protein R3E95_11195 [Thiolinea sp.]
MNKTYTVHASHHKEISPGKGSIVWLISDERGMPRKVAAITSLDEQGVIETVQAVYRREIPLVERLQHTDKGSQFSIDFSRFNQDQNYLPREAYRNLRNQEKTAGLSAQVIRVLLALGTVALLWFAYTVFMDVMQMNANFPR